MKEWAEVNIYAMEFERHNAELIVQALLINLDLKLYVVNSPYGPIEYKIETAPSSSKPKPGASK